MRIARPRIRESLGIRPDSLHLTAPVFFVLTAALVAAACGSTSSTTVGPSPVKCEVALESSPSPVGGNGGSRNVGVSAQPECMWRATSQVSWITRVNPASGQGSGQVGFDVLTNPGPARTGALVIGTQTLTVMQDGVCTYTVQPTSQSVPAAAGARTVTVGGGQGCPWTSTSNVAWMTVTSGGSGSGPGAVGFDVALNTGPERSGALTVAGRTATVTQASGCVYSISPLEHVLGQFGDTRTVSVSSQAGCPWDASTDSPSWITILSGASGAGDGVVVYRVAAIILGTRTGHVTIAGQTHTVIQER